MKKKLLSIFMVTIIAAGLLAGCTSKTSENNDEDAIRIVHKNFTEQRLVGQLFSVYLESKGFKTTVSELGGTMLCFNALKGGDADLYAEYTGSGYMGILGETEILSADATYDYVKNTFENDYGITWLKPLGWNNTYILSVTSQTAQDLDLKTTSDLIPYSGTMVIGCTAEFANRTDGYPGLVEAYPGLSFKKVMSMDQGLTYEALKNGELDVNVSFSTDGRIAKFNLVNLEDDAGFFPPYHCVPILKQSFAKEHPDLVEALDAIENKWSDSDMQTYNLRVDEGEDARDVATEMLKDAGLMD